MGEVVARAALGLRESEPELATRDGGKPPRLLRRRSAACDEPGAQADGREEGLDDERLADRLHDADEIERAAAEAAELGGQRQAQDAELGKRRPHRRTAALVHGNRSPARFEAVFLRHEPLDRRGQQLLLFVVVEIHCGSFAAP